MRHALIFVSSLLLVQALTMQLAFACDCKPRTPPKEREGSLTKKPTYEFSWYSDADRKEDDRYCYERSVSNKHEKSLDYEWKMAEMENKALPPKEEDSICKVRGAHRDEPARGPLSYGRNNPPVDTEVWKAKLEPRTGETSQVVSFSPVETALEFVFVVSGQIIRNSVVLRSFVSIVDTPSGRVFRYRYLLENLREDPAIISWVPRLPEFAKNDPRLTPLLKETSEGLAIEVRGIIQMRLDDRQSPILATFPVNFFEPGHKSMARGSAEAYVPPK